MHVNFTALHPPALVPWHLLQQQPGLDDLMDQLAQLVLQLSCRYSHVVLVFEVSRLRCRRQHGDGCS